MASKKRKIPFHRFRQSIYFYIQPHIRLLEQTNRKKNLSEMYEITFRNGYCDFTRFFNKTSRYTCENVYEYSYFIGKEAAGQIISYVQKHSTETKSSTSLPTISGTVTEIGNGYIMVDDTVLCKKSKAGKKYKVYTDDIKIRRWIESGELKEGDLVIVEYEGEISSNYEVKGAYSIFTGTLEENGILNQE